MRAVMRFAAGLSLALGVNVAYSTLYGAVTGRINTQLNMNKYSQISHPPGILSDLKSPSEAVKRTP